MKRFEFSYVDDNKDMHFVVVFDEDIVSACERVLCRPVSLAELQESINNNSFVKGWENTRFAIHEQPFEPSSHVAMPTNKVNSILEGLI